ncbi:MAG: fumarylacetoacetate hydrolase family protein [Kutzneria sp.]|nr:fumarylacetoacetate hydrolase family protein [Kutzneria sp.]
MRLARISHSEGASFVAIGGEPDSLIAAELGTSLFVDPTFTGRTWPLASVELLAPIRPSKVVCVGKNYADHAREMGGEAPVDPVIFLKPSTSVIGPGADIVLPADSARVDYEGELAVVIGGVPAKDVKVEDARSVILGYTIANDVTARDQQQADGQWTRAKGHDTFCPLGPWIETSLDPADLELRTEVDGETRQDCRTSELVHGVGELIAWISHAMTLLPGDVVLTGTPAGVGPMTAGQTVSVSVEGIGTLTNTVVGGP